MLALQDYRAVVALLEDRHFGHAARRLGVTQSALSVRLRRIEAALDVRLFERGRSGVRPTAAGLAFAEGGRRVLDAADEASRSAVDAAQGFGETIRIGMTQVAAYQVMARILRAFRAAQPRARIRLTEGTTVALEARLERREIDAAFLHPPIHSSELSERRLTSCDLVRIDLAGAKTSPLIRYPRAEAPVLMGRLGREDDHEGRVPRGEADTVLGAMLMSEAGYGACVVPADFPYLQGRPIPDRATPQGPFPTSVAWRSLDRRPVITSLIACAAAE